MHLVLASAVGHCFLSPLEARSARISNRALHAIKMQQLIRQRARTASDIEHSAPLP